MAQTAHSRSAEVARLMINTILPQTLSRPSLPNTARQQMLTDLRPVGEAMGRQDYKTVIDTANSVNAFGRIAIAEYLVSKLPLPDNIRVELGEAFVDLKSRWEGKNPNANHKIAQDATNLSTRVINESDKARVECVLERALELYADFEVMSPEDQIFLLSALASLGKLVSQIKHPNVDWTKVHDRMSPEYIKRNLPGLAERVLDAKSVANFGRVFEKSLTRDLGHVAAARPQLVPRRVRKAERSTKDRSHLQAIGA